MRTAPNCRRPGRTCFSELETSKGGSDIIDCLRRAHIAALSLELLGISHHGTDLESRSRGLARARQAAGPWGFWAPETFDAFDNIDGLVLSKEVLSFGTFRGLSFEDF